MKCAETEEMLLLKESGELDADREAELLEHIEKCPACRKLADRNQRVLDILGPPPEMPVELANSILNSARQRDSRRNPWISRLVRDFGLAAAVSAAAILLFFLLLPGTDKTEIPERITLDTKEKTVKNEQETIKQDIKRAIADMDLTTTTALNGGLSSQLDEVKVNVEATRYMLTTPVKAGLERQIGNVKDKILILKEEMTKLAFYNGD